MKNAVSGLGLAPDAAMVTFPIDMFLPGSDLTAIGARKKEFYNALMKWKPDFAQGAGGELPMLSVEGKTYEDALQKANNLLITNLWGDGLPVWPATRERVNRMLRGTPLPRTQVIKKLWEYFKKNKLNDGQTINLDDKLKAVYGNKKTIKMTEVSKAFSHLKD